MKTVTVGLVAHVDAGKTTLTEQLLYAGGCIARPGRVDKGDTQTDFLSIERQRGISVQSAVTCMEHNGVRVNLIDAPGHSDFLADVEQSLCVLSVGILLVSAVEGIQAQTRVLWRALKKLDIPVVCFLNKVDRVGSRAEAVRKALAGELGMPVVPMNLPVGEGSREVGLVPDPEDAALAAAEVDEAVAESLLEDETPDAGRVAAALEKLMRAGSAVPLFHGCAQQGLGVKELLTFVESLAQEPPETGEPGGRVFKVEHDPAMGLVAHVRLFEGAIRNRDTVTNTTRGVSEKVTQIRRFTGQKGRDVGFVGAGDVAALYGLSSARVGDALGHYLPKTGGVAIPPLLRVELFPDQPERLTELAEAAEILCREIPGLSRHWDKVQSRLSLSVAGRIQMEVLQQLLQERFDLPAHFGQTVVLYRETPAGIAEGFEAYTMPKPCWAVVRLDIRPLKRGDGVRFYSTVADSVLLPRYQNHVEQSLFQNLEQGLRGFPLTDMQVTLTDGGWHHFHTHPLDFFVATPLALFDGLTRCGTRLLEPMLRCSMTGPEDRLGRLMGELLNCRGDMEESSLDNQRFYACAQVPVAEALDFPQRFAVLTGGQGTLETEFAGYREAPADTDARLPRLGVDPRDRSKWILYCRSALS